MSNIRRPKRLCGDAQRFPQNAPMDYRKDYRNKTIGLSYKMAVVSSYKMAVIAPTKWPWKNAYIHRLFHTCRHTEMFILRG